MDHDRRRILVTGGAGFIGSNFVRYVLDQRSQWRVVNLDALTYAGNPQNLAGLEKEQRHTFVHGDVRNRETVMRAVAGCDGVVHFAAESHVDRSIMNSDPFVSTNVHGTQVLLDACERLERNGHGVDRFLHIGTDEVYGDLPLDRPDLKFTERTALEPSSPYSASKAGADLLALAFHRTFALPVVVSRCSNNFGPYQYPEKVIPLFITNLIDGRKVPLYGDGKNVRDWLHVTDHCEALLMLLEQGRPGEVYNIGGSNERSNNELTHTLLELMGLGADMIEPVTDRPGHDRRYAIDATKIREELGWSPTRSGWPHALTATIEWYRANEAWWRPLKERLLRSDFSPSDK